MNPTFSSEDDGSKNFSNYKNGKIEPPGSISHGVS